MLDLQTELCKADRQVCLFIRVGTPVNCEDVEPLVQKEGQRRQAVVAVSGSALACQECRCC